MPVTIPYHLPARKTLEDENIFVMSDLRAHDQDIRPLRIAILNLMPTKIDTETQLLRLLSNSPLQVEITLINMGSHESKNTPPEHLAAFYSSFDKVEHQKFDGLIITGAPVEQIPFEDVDYWDELVELMDWSMDNVFSTMHVCWGAQAGLYHHYGIKKYPLSKKMFGVFRHRVLEPRDMILKGFDDVFMAPHSRHTEVRREDIEKVRGIRILAESDEAGIYLSSSMNGRMFFVTGHPEYDSLTLKKEYDRDVAKGLEIDVPRNYYPGDNPAREPLVEWRSHANLLYANWLNYCIYQLTPFDLNAIPGGMTPYEDE
jgi:homoserine O-succinyltransferase/O-acetyltransferase